MTVISCLPLGRTKLPQRFASPNIFWQKHPLQLWRGVAREASLTRASWVVQSRLDKLLAGELRAAPTRLKPGHSKCLTLRVHLRLLSFRRCHAYVSPSNGISYRAASHK